MNRNLTPTDSAATPDLFDANMPGTKQFTIGSGQENHWVYRIYVSWPQGEPPADGFPVIYVLDANSVIGTMIEAVRLQSGKQRGSGPSMAVVGIGYETDKAFSTERFTDYSLPMPVEELPPYSRGGEWPRQGGADAFLRFIEERLKPLIARMFPVNVREQAIFGHSLGGLFALHALFTRTDAFQTYIAGSPSIDWYKRLILDEERLWRTSLGNDKKLNARLLVTAGEMERDHPTRINDNAKELVERLKPHMDSGLHVEYREFEGENHISVLPVLISRAVRFFKEGLE
ncbi:alpha/beta hydrolase [Paenibacillus hemerocallicola]|nr:alpha/beta hydrolase-fold protein [Paenibacillus hemerocallicola]